MNNAKRVISLKKIVYNIKHYFWILIVTVVLAIAIVAVLIMTVKPQPVFKVKNIFQIKVQRLEGVDPLIVEGQKIIDELGVFFSSATVAEEMDERLNEAEFDSYSDEIPTFIATNNIVVMELQGSNKERTEYLSKLFLTKVEEYISSLDKEIVVEVLDSSTEEIDTTGNRIINSRNIYILLLGAIFGCAIICVIIYFDNRIYIKEDLYYLDSLKYLYSAIGKPSINRIYRIVEHYKVGEYKVVLVSVKDSEKYDFLEKNEKVLVPDNAENLKYIDNSAARIIILFAVGEDTIKEAQSLIYLLKSLEKQIVGYILVE